jgi:K+-transporting ATPase A subunit
MLDDRWSSRRWPQCLPGISSSGNFEWGISVVTLGEFWLGVLQAVDPVTASRRQAHGSCHGSREARTDAARFVGILLAEISPGGDGGGPYSMLVFALLAVFVAGLMLGRTPEFLGKKIRAPQMKLVIAYVLVVPVVVLVLGSLSLVLSTGTKPILNPGFHGLSEVMYAYASVALNNGSAFAGLAANTPWYDASGRDDHAAVFRSAIGEFQCFRGCGVRR